MENNNMMNNNVEKKSKMPIIILLLVLIAAIAAGVIFFFVTKDNKNDKPKETEKTESNKQPVVQSDWNGIYENNGNTIKFYQPKENKIFFILEINGSFICNQAKVSGNTITFEEESFGEKTKYTFTLNGENVEFTSTSDYLGNGTYTKRQDYGTEDYFKDVVGDPSYLSSKFNGVYKKDNYSITMYQIKEDTVEIVIQKGTSFSSRSLPIVNDSLVYEDEFLGEIERINISVNGNELTVTASSDDQDSLLNSINGTYTKEKDYTIDDILNDLY